MKGWNQAIYKTRLVSKEIFSPWNKIHGEVRRAKDLSATLYEQVSLNTVFLHGLQPPHSVGEHKTYGTAWARDQDFQGAPEMEVRITHYSAILLKQSS